MEQNTFPRSEAVPDRFHERKILTLQVRCPNDHVGCKWTGQLRLLKKHLGENGDCKFDEFECPFSFAGCDHLLTRANVESHKQEYVAKHLDLMQSKFQEAKSQNARLIQTVATLETKQTELQDQVSSLERQNLQLRGPAQHTFTVHWDINNWRETLETAKQEDSYSIISRPYYIDRPGYKVCLQAYPNGYQRGASTHLSLFLKIMRGSCDDQLVWPYPLMYTITVVDQQPGGKDVSRSQDPPISSAGAASSFRKPTSESNVGWGWHEFISHEVLTTRCYTKDGTVRVRLDIYLK
jgi:hypothetical protein